MAERPERKKEMDLILLAILKVAKEIDGWPLQDHIWLLKNSVRVSFREGSVLRLSPPTESQLVQNILIALSLLPRWRILARNSSTWDVRVNFKTGWIYRLTGESEWIVINPADVDPAFAQHVAETIAAQVRDYLAASR